MRKRLVEKSPSKIDIYTDFLDLARFPNESDELRSARYLAEKYAGRSLDIIMPLNSEAERFLLKYRNIIAPKTLLTRAQVQTLIEHPLNPAIRLDASSRDKYCIIDYDLLYPLAPGVVLIKSPGHTPGSQMVYVHLASGKEILLIGDITWAMAGIELQRLKPEATSKLLGEDRTAIKTEIGWLRNVTGKLNLINSHDDDSIAAQIKQGVLEDGLDVQRP